MVESARDTTLGTAPPCRLPLPLRAGAALLALAALVPWSRAGTPAQRPKGGTASSEVVSGGLAIAVRARALAPGEAVRILVRDAGDPESPREGENGPGTGAPRLSSVTGTFLGQTLSFSPAGTGDTWSAWTVVGFDEKAGTKLLAIEAKDAEGRARRAERQVRIGSKSFPTERLTVKQEYVEPSPAVAERIAAETKRLAALYAERSPSALQGTPFARPVPGEPLGIFGARRILNGKPRAPHPGLDLRAPAGTPVVSAGPGRVALAEDLYFSGNTVIVDHGEGLFTIYAHLSRIDVDAGEKIDERSPIGLSGATGRVTGPHLHWGAKIGDRPFDPTALLDRSLFR